MPGNLAECTDRRPVLWMEDSDGAGNGVLGEVIKVVLGHQEGGVSSL